MCRRKERSRQGSPGRKGGRNEVKGGSEKPGERSTRQGQRCEMRRVRRRRKQEEFEARAYKVIQRRWERMRTQDRRRTRGLGGGEH